MNPILLVGIVVVAAAIISKGKAASAFTSLQFQFKKINLSFEGVMGILPLIQLTLSVINPTDRSLDLKSITGKVYLNGSYAGDIYSLNNPQIIANGITDISFTVKSSISDVINNAVKMLSGGAAPQVVLRFQGEANVEGIQLPVDFEARVL